ncbi:MAG: cofactor-independent phosphoglycerate mutase [Spirochaetota bacterium]|nr:cofactor-independent phosphoglycerate mutase [Spirochaetota bacterium]
MKLERKIVILVGDGMADYPIPEHGNRTPLEIAATPHMDHIASNGIIGLAKTIPDGMTPGSDTANLSIFGYDPKKYFTGRAPLEALNMGIEMAPKDVAFRCNLVNIDKNDIMMDFSAGHIDTDFTKIIIEELKNSISFKDIEIYPGVKYRNILIWRNFPYDTVADTTPPHDIHGEKTKNYLPKGDGADFLIHIMDEYSKIINGSDLIKDSRDRFQGDPTSLWLWGGGKKPFMDSLESRFGLKGYTISAVDLIHGIGRAVGLAPIHVEGVTGYLDTNYEGKSDASIKALKQSNFVFLHVESPDESGHEGNLEHKIMAIEDFDSRVVGRVLEGLKDYDDYTVLVISDHPTPISLRTHVSDPVPFCILSSRGLSVDPYTSNNISGFNEGSALKTGLFIEEGHRLVEIMISGRI